ncbi:hypothetical protein ACHAXS_008380 [Conticribra weissflogii]
MHQAEQRARKRFQIDEHHERRRLLHFARSHCLPRGERRIVVHVPCIIRRNEVAHDSQPVPKILLRHVLRAIQFVRSSNSSPSSFLSLLFQGHGEIGASSGILAGISSGKTFTKGTWSSEFHPSMTPQPADLVVEGKRGLCGFFSTNLDFLLRQRGVKNVVLAGFLTNCCIESTMRTAYEHGYDVYTLKDASAATSVAAHEAAFEHNFGMFSTVSTCEEVMAAVAVAVEA